jgi:hypothetical protein
LSKMFVVVDLSRYWFMLKLMEASWSIPAGEIVAIVVSGTQGGSVRKTPLFAPFRYKTIILPRQARDKHRKS